MSIRKFKAQLADGVTAYINKVHISHTYEGLIHGSYARASVDILEEVEMKRKRMNAGILPGYYYFEPEMLDYYELSWGVDDDGKDGIIRKKVGKCFKDNKLVVEISIDDMEERGKQGEYLLTLVWYQDTRELSQKPFTELIQNQLRKLKVEDIKRYCKFVSYDSPESEGFR